MKSSIENIKASSRRGFLQKIGVISLFPLIDCSFLAADNTTAFYKRNNLKILTCNIRVDLLEDEQRGLGWKQRRTSCIEIIKRKKADVICLQEVLRNQFWDLKNALTDFYAIGFDGPEMDKRKEGYHGIAKNPIFYSKKRFELLNAGGYWLSENPLEAASLSWGSARARNASWVRLLDKKTNKELRVINLHLDHIKEEAKLEQVKLVLKESDQYQKDFVQVLTGDFNSPSNSSVIQEVLKMGWIDTFEKNTKHGSLQGTTHSFKADDEERAKKAKKIDYIFIKGAIRPQSSEIIMDSYKGVYPSDHYFLEAVIEY